MSLPIAPFATLQATEERSSLNPFRSAVTGKDALIGKTGPEYSPD
jgi:hypothetical protein